MRSVLAVLLSLTLFLSTSIAQAGPQSKSASSERKAPIVVVSAPEGPAFLSAMYECDGEQCESGGGGAVWLFSGNKGQSMWHYAAVADLTVVKFDGSHIQIHRADPAGTYSDAFKNANAPGFFAEYYGTISGNQVTGVVSWNGDPKPPTSPWHATIVGEGFCSDGRCPLDTHQLSLFGRRVSAAGMYPQAYRCFELAAQAGDTDAMGFQGEMMVNGWGGKHTPDEIIDLLETGADKGSYAADRELAHIYSEGRLVPKNPREAARWNKRADDREAQVAAEERSAANRANMGKFLEPMALFLILAAAMSGGSSGGGGGSYNQDAHWERQTNEADCAGGDSYACGKINQPTPHDPDE